MRILNRYYPQDFLSFEIAHDKYSLFVSVDEFGVTFDLTISRCELYRLELNNRLFGWKSTEDQVNWWLQSDSSHNGYHWKEEDRINVWLDDMKVMEFRHYMFPNFYKQLHDGFMSITHEDY